MPTRPIGVSYRPLRVGFVVEWGDVSALARVAEINSLLWGGIFNPILPVGSCPELPAALVALFSPDLLFAIGDSPHISAFTNNYQHLRTLHHATDTIFSTDWRSEKQTVTVLDIMHLIQHYWDTDLRHKRRTSKASVQSLIGMLLIPFPC